MAFAEALLLIIVANSAPVALGNLLDQRLNWPLDVGLRLADGEPLFGASKTLRGLCAALLGAGLAALALGQPFGLGLKAGAATMLGDLLSSFVKRRLRLPSSSRATGLDQIPESLFPALVLAPELGLSVVHVLFIVLTFFLLNALGSPIFYRLKLRKTPH